MLPISTRSAGLVHRRALYRLTYVAGRHSRPHPRVNNVSSASHRHQSTAPASSPRFGAPRANDDAPPTRATAAGEATSQWYKTTVLSNKLTIRTLRTPVDTPIGLASFALVIHAGPRFETGATAGASHVLEKSILIPPSVDNPATKVLPSRAAAHLKLEWIPNLEYQTICSTHLPTRSSLALSDLASLVRTSSFSPATLEAMLNAAVHEASASEVSPEERILYLARVSGWGHRGLGNDALVDLSGGGIADVHLQAGEGGDCNDGETQTLLLRFRETWYRPERMTLVGVGLDHERLVELAEEHLGERPLPRSREQLVSTPLAAWSTTPGALQQLSPPPEALLEATIAPSSTTLQADSIPSTACRLASFFGLGGTPSPPPPLPPPVLPPPLPDSTPPSELASLPSEFAGGCLAFDVLDGGPTYVAVAFEGLPEGHPDTFILEVIARILGGRSRFQAGGPGSTHQKTRLAKHVLAPLPFIQHIEAFNHAYSDAGLMGVTLSLDPDSTTPFHFHEALDRTLQQFRALALPPPSSPPSRPSRRPSSFASGARALENRPRKRAAPPTHVHVTERELERAKAFTTVAWCLERENPWSLANLDDLALARPPTSEVRLAIARVTLQDVRRVAGALFVFAARLVVVGRGAGAQAGLMSVEERVRAAGLALGRKE